MVTKVVIRDNKNTPIHYLPDLKNFKNGKEYVFKSGVNIIVGENGCGKTTLMELIRKYLLVDLSECSKGTYNSNINALFQNFLDKDKMWDGADVYADYQRNTFRLCHVGERKHNEDVFADDYSIGEFMSQKWSSTGEGVVVAMNSLFSRMFSNGARLKFDYTQFKDDYLPYIEYVANHIIEGDEWTILMDEPDRNLSIENLRQIYGVLNVHKSNVQIIAVVHNPLLICALSKNHMVNVIEMTNGYVGKIRKFVNEMIK